MPAFLVQYELIDKAPIYPDVVSFLSTNAQGKSDVFFTVMQLALESYTALGFNVPKSKADIRNFLLYLRNSTIKNNAFSEKSTNQIVTKTIPANNSYSFSSEKKKNKKEQASNPETTSPASPQKKEEVKKEAEKEPKAAKPKSNFDFEMFNYSMKDNEVKTPSSAPALKKEAKEKPMTTQQPKAEAKNGEDDYMTFDPDMSYFTPPEELEADDVPRKPILGKRSPII